jgi:8-oxo-dGTP pyrophosphatase MutT (NUDIX family)
MIDTNLVQYYNDNYRDRYNIKHITDCGVILLNNQVNKILLVFQRASLKWGLPKGHMTKMEKDKQDYFACASRELQEETGIVLSKMRYRRIGQIIINNKMFYVIQMLTRNIDYVPIDTKEILGVGWIEENHIFNFVQQHNCNRTLKELAQMCEQMMKNKQRVSYIPPAMRQTLLSLPTGDVPTELRYDRVIAPKYDESYLTSVKSMQLVYPQCSQTVTMSA